MSREYTTKLIELLNEGVLDPRTLIQACLEWMSEADVKAMCVDGDLSPYFEQDEDEDEESA